MIGPLSDATTPGHRRPESDGNEGVVNIPQRSSITVASPSDCLMSYTDNRCGGLPLCRDAVSVLYSPCQLGLLFNEVNQERRLIIKSMYRFLSGCFRYIQHLPPSCVFWGGLHVLNVLQKFLIFRLYIFIYIVSKVGDRTRGRPESSLFDGYYPEV